MSPRNLQAKPRRDSWKENGKKWIGIGKYNSADIIEVEPLLGEELLHPLEVVPLELDGGALHRAPARELPLEELGQVAEVDVAGIDPLDDRDLFPVPPPVDLHGDPLLFLCYLLTDA